MRVLFRQQEFVRLFFAYETEDLSSLLASITKSVTQFQLQSCAKGRDDMQQLGTWGSAGKLNGVANGKNGHHHSGEAMAQIQVPVPIKRPRDGKAWVGYLVGGYKDTRPAITDKLLDLYGIDCSRDFLDGTIRQSTKISIPRRVEVIVILTDAIRTGGLPRIVHTAQEAGIPYVGIAQRVSAWRDPMARAGFDTPPLWRGDAAIVRETAAHADDDEPVSPKVAPESAPAPTTAPSAVVSSTSKQVVDLRKWKRPAGTPNSKPYVSLPIAKAIQNARLAAGLSRDDLADMLGQASCSVMYWELGYNLPLFAPYQKMRELFADLPEVLGLRGEVAAAAAATQKATPAPPVVAPAAAPIIVVPPPATPYVPPARRDFHDDFHDTAPAPAQLSELPRAQPKPAPVAAVAPVAAPAAPQPSSSVPSTLQDLITAAKDLEAADAALAEAHQRREAALAKLNAAHATLTKARP